jgi:hypothetical protein
MSDLAGVPAVTPNTLTKNTLKEMLCESLVPGNRVNSQKARHSNYAVPANTRGEVGDRGAANQGDGGKLPAWTYGQAGSGELGELALPFVGKDFIGADNLAVHGAGDQSVAFDLAVLGVGDGDAVDL